MESGDLRPWNVFMSQAIREAALKPTAANAYPYLPARMWTAARRLAELVARYRGIPVDAVNRLNRVLSDRDFMFRGGTSAGNLGLGVSGGT
jgi:hypothetical protein